MVVGEKKIGEVRKSTTVAAITLECAATFVFGHTNKRHVCKSKSIKGNDDLFIFVFNFFLKKAMCKHI